MSYREISLLSPRKWLVVFWILSTLLITMSWWAGLAWAAIEFAQAVL
jgi:hypothetical protein